MRKLFTAKPGKMIGLFLLLGIVALQWSFTTAVTGENRAVNLLTDTSTTPLVGTAVATSNKITPKRSNRTTTSSKPALAANLDRETISFGSPTGGPDTETSSPKINNKKTAVTGSTKATVVKATEAKGTDTKTTDKKTTDAKVTDTKATDAKSTNTKSGGAAVTKNDGTGNTKTALPEKKPVEGAGTNTTKPVKGESAGAAEPKSTGVVNTKSASTGDTKGTDAVKTKNTETGATKSAGAAEPKNTGTVNTKNTETGVTKSTGIAETKSPGTTGTKSTATVETKKSGTAATKKVDAGTTVNKSTTTAKTTGTANTKRTGTADAKSANVKTTSTAVAKYTSTAGEKTLVTAAKPKTASSIGILSNKLVVYDSLHLKQAGLSKKVFAMALTGMSKLLSARHIKDNLLAIVDFSQPSNKKRLYVIDLNNYQLLYNTYVAHGMRSGRAMAQSFSNKPSSEKSSLGFFVTGPAYKGTNGYSLRLTGVEKGINDHAMDRGIVIHGADYVCEGLIESQGFIGRSFGCPAVAQEVSQELIDLLKGGSCLFIYHPSPVYKAKSTLIQ
jgi:hypothetical protein